MCGATAIGRMIIRTLNFEQGEKECKRKNGAQICRSGGEIRCDVREGPSGKALRIKIVCLHNSGDALK